MSNPILLRAQRRVAQPRGIGLLTPEYFNRSAICLLPTTGLDLINRAQANHGKRLTRGAPVLKASAAGIGVGCSNTTRSYLDTDWVNPLQSEVSDGTGAFSLLLAATLTSAAARSIPFHVRLNSGAFNTVFIVQNGGRDEGADTSYNEAGTLWMGTFEGVTNHARGLKVTGAFGAAPTQIAALFNRYADGTTSLWLNGVKAASNAVGYQTAITTGAAQYLALGGFASADGFASPDPVNLLYAANRAFGDAQSSQISRNPWSIFQVARRIWVPVSAGGGALAAAASGGSSASGSANLSAQIALGAVGVALAGGSAALSADVPLSAAGISIASGSAGPTASITISAAGLAQAAGEAGLSAEVLLTASGAAQASGNAVLAAQLSAQAAGAAQAGGASVLSVVVQLVASGAAQAGGTANLTGGPPGAISASGTAQAAGSAVASVDVSLSAAGFVQAIGAGQLVVHVALSASGGAIAAGLASLSAGGVVRNVAACRTIRIAAERRRVGVPAEQRRVRV